MLATEGVTIDFADDGIAALARIAAEVNESVENIGARRLADGDGKIARGRSASRPRTARGETLMVDAAFVDAQLAGIARNTDLSRYVL